VTKKINEKRKRKKKKEKNRRVIVTFCNTLKIPSPKYFSNKKARFKIFFKDINKSLNKLAFK
jgi:hypothetical protein